MQIDIFDVECLAITDDSGEIILQSNTHKESSIICKKAVEEGSYITLINNKVVLLKRIHEVFIILFADEDRNELLLSNYLDVFCSALFKLMTNPTKEILFKKYDQVCFLLNAFLYEGIVLETNSDALVKKVPLRSFEGLESMYIPKNFTSFLSSASNTLKSKNKERST